MKLSEYTIEHLARAIAGDAVYTPYLTGPKLINFFNKYGFNDRYESGFPSRWIYAQEKVRTLNGSPKLRAIVEEIVDPRRYHEFQHTVEYAVEQINEFLRYDKYELRKNAEFYKLAAVNGPLITGETTKEINHEFIREQQNKCTQKIADEDFNGAITNARTLVEAVFIEIIENADGTEQKNDGDIDNLWRKVKKILKLDVDKATMPEYVIQIISGMETALKGLAALSNNGADRHANKFKTRRHHAKLAVNLSMTVTDFLLDSRTFQVTKSSSPNGAV